MTEALLGDVLSRRLEGASPHGNNLAHQFSAKSAAHSSSALALNDLAPMYLNLCDHIDTADFDNTADFDEDSFYKTATELLDQYLQRIREIGSGVFASQSDFITSVLPEFFLRMFYKLCSENTSLTASGQRDIIIDLSFDTRMPSLLIPTMQRVDLAIGYSTSLSVAETKTLDLYIPIFAAEAKTYFDKNMLSGVDFSAAKIKSTFPHCVYLAFSEFADFDLGALSYASSSIDEIYILRKQKRSEYRKHKSANSTSWSNVKEVVEIAAKAVATCEIERASLHDRLSSGILVTSN